MIQAAESQADYQHDRQVQRGGEVGHGLGVVQGRLPSPCSLDDDQIGLGGKAVEGVHDWGQFDASASICRRDVR